MTIEDQLRDMMVLNYGSVKEFADAIGVAPTTIFSVLKRGIKNSSVTTVIKIAHELDISVDGLADGKIIANSAKPVLIEANDVGDLSRAMRLMAYRDMFYGGEKLTFDEKNQIADAVDIGIEMIGRRREREA